MGRVRLALFLAVLCAVLVVVPSAAAATFTVNSTGDQNDLNFGSTFDGVCDADATVVTECTLRAALQEANADLGTGDVIDFSIPGVDKTIGVGSELPAILSTTEIYGCAAPTVPPATTFATAPCTGVRATTAKDYDGLTIQGGNVIIHGLAITNFERGIKYTGTGPGSDRRILGNWFGLRLDETTEGNNTGADLQGNFAMVGGTTGAPGTAMADRNVFAANGVGVRAAGTSSSIIGNYFGVKADGTTAAANTSAAIRVTGGAQIGGFLSPTAQATAECDEYCNVIAGSNTALNKGIELEDTATGVTIRGNYIGLNRLGAEPTVPPLLAPQTGIDVKGADNVTVGGISAAGDRNVIVAANTGVRAGSVSAPDAFVLQNNYVGTDRTGNTEAGNNTFTAADLRSVDVPLSNIDPITVSGNVIAVAGNYGLLLSGESATVSGNSIGVGPGSQPIGGGPGTIGIRMVESASGPADGMLIDGNVIGNTGGWAVSLEGGDDNTFIRNRIGLDPSGNPEPNAARGIALATFFGQQPTGNVIGSDTASDENILSNNALFAIGVADDVAAGNTFAGNRGTSNGRFIDVGNLGSGNGTVAHEGIEAPEIVAANQDKVVGTGEPDSTVRLFFKATSDVGEIDSQRAGTGVVGSDGVWTWTPTTAPMPLSQKVAVTQTTDNDSTSELSETATLGASGSDVTPPDATITAPASPTNDSPPSFGLDSNETPELFICRVGTSGPYSECTDPFSPSLADGTHTIQVKAVDEAGNIQVAPTEDTITVDTQAPDAPGVDGPSGPTNEDSPSFDFTGEAGATFNCAFDGDPPQECDDGYIPDPAPLPDDTYTLDVTQTDQAGNESDEESVTFTVDTVVQPPSITDGPTGPTNDSTPTFTFTGESGATFSCVIDSGASTPCNSGTFTPTALSEGNHTFTVTQTDAATNTSEPSSRSFTVDTVAPPAPVITDGPPMNTSDSTPTFTFMGETNATTRCAIDSGTLSDCPGGSFTAAPLADGPHTFRVVQTDQATNVSPQATRSFTLDTVAPDTQIDSGPGEGAITDSTPTFGFSSPGNSGVGFRCRFDSQPFGACRFAGQETPASALSAGRHAFEVRAVDPAGNVDATPARRSFVVGQCRGKAATYVGNAKSNLLTAGPSADVILGLGGGDLIRGLGGNDVACGGAGRDRLNGGAGKDVLLGQGGGDVLSGGPGPDRLVGGAGPDRLVGGPGKDSQKQ